jgi:serine/threonine protein kinase
MSDQEPGKPGDQVPKETLPGNEAGAAPVGGGITDSGSFPAGAVLSDRYRVIGFIARGGMGEVYEVEDLQLRVRIALKTILASGAGSEVVRERFRREILLARSISHSNICRTYDLGIHRTGAFDTVFLTMELLKGESLSNRIRRLGRLREEEAAPLLVQIASALDAAHEQGVLHRDFKSANVLIVPTKNGERVVITDFGIALALEDREPTAQRLTSADHVVGTVEYMAPEQITGGPLTSAVDIYSLGVVMYEMVTGVLPHEGRTPMQIIARRLNHEPEAPRKFAPGLDPRWESVILRCLSRDPQDRFRRASDSVEALTLPREVSVAGPAEETFLLPSDGVRERLPKHAATVNAAAVRPESATSPFAPAGRARALRRSRAASIVIPVLVLLGLALAWVFLSRDRAGEKAGPPDAPATGPPDIRWRPRAVMPTPRLTPTVVSFNGLIYTLGGWEGPWGDLERSAAVEIYDPSSDTWTRGPDMPTARGAAAGTLLNGKIYVIGGRTSVSGTLLDAVERYDPEKRSWSTLAPLPDPGARHLLACTAGPSTVFVLGGWAKSGLKTFQEYDPAKDRWVTRAPMSFAREKVAAVFLGGRVYALGGRLSDSTVRFKAVEAYDIASGTWAGCTDLPVSFQGAAAVLDGKIYAMADSKTYEFTPSENRWTELSGTFTPNRTELIGGACVANGRIYLVGGLADGVNAGLVEEGVLQER